MKTLLKIVFIILISLSLFSINTYGYSWVDVTIDFGLWTNSNSNDYLSDFENNTYDFHVEDTWEIWINNIFIRVARDIKNIFFIVSTLIFIILVIKLLLSDKTEEEVSKFKKWIIWVSIWIIIMQIWYKFMYIAFDKNIDNNLATNIIHDIIEPFIYLLQTGASFFFLSIMIYSFFLLVTAGWDEEKVKNWKMAILYAAIWFIIIKISNILVSSVYWEKINQIQSWLCTAISTDCNISWTVKIIVNIINWMNTFIYIIIVLMIIYAWFTILISGWDEEKLKKAKSSILYIVIWLFILIMNYLILTFFIFPEVII